jgi:hypothetical protein
MVPKNTERSRFPDLEPLLQRCASRYTSCEFTANRIAQRASWACATDPNLIEIADIKSHLLALVHTFALEELGLRPLDAMRLPRASDNHP